MKKKKRINEKKLIIKMILCLVYLIIITILSVCTYKLYIENENILPWSEVESTKDYTYIKVYRMSEKFAYYDDLNVGIHFVIDREETGQWHTYLVAINEDDYNKYKDIIDYTYDRTEKEPSPKKIYGYPTITSKELKQMAIKNIKNFVPAENEIEITEENYETYLTNSYLDTTRKREDQINGPLFLLIIILIVSILLLIMTILGRDKLSDKIYKKL